MLGKALINRAASSLRDASMKVNVGDKAPDFTLLSQTGENVTLSQFYGKKNVVLCFYPKDETPGCTREACTFRGSYELVQNEVVVVVICYFGNVAVLYDCCWLVFYSVFYLQNGSRFFIRIFPLRCSPPPRIARGRRWLLARRAVAEPQRRSVQSRSLM